MNDLIQSTGASPFDSIRRVRPDGAEYWSARDLMPLAGYAQWRDFQTAIERAMLAAQNSGHNVARLFARTRKNSGGRPAEDFELARFAAYLVSLNGDPSKPETAAAQAYFVIRTHEAETAAVRDIAPLSARDVLAIAQRLVEQEERAIEAEARAVKSERVVDAIEAAEGLTPTQFHKQYFSDVPERKFFEHLYRLRLLIDQRGARGRDAKGRLKNGHEHGDPAAAGKAFFYLHGRLDEEGVRRESTRVRPGRPEVELVEFLASKGLPANTNALTTTPVKEIAA